MKKNLLIIYPHWPPSNLAGVHRPRLISNFLPEFGWHPIVLTVEESAYEEKPDFDILKTVRKETEVIKCKGGGIIRLFGKRLIGDIGLRSFRSIFRQAMEILQEREIDFIWTPIPSFYMALLGRLLYEKTNIPYGIDYIDPWVRPLAPYEQKISRAGLSRLVARLLEPIAVKKAALISGVATAYYQPVLDRNFKNKPIVHVGMPYGFDPDDHKIELSDVSYPWSGKVIPFVYAGAFLPQSQIFVQALFQVLSKLVEEGVFPENGQLYFLGTGNYSGKSISDYAEEAGISQYVTEIKQRFPFLHIQQFLRKSEGILIIGSTERHYTASKTFQCLLSGRPVWAIFHEDSSATKIMQECRADRYLSKYQDGQTINSIELSIEQSFKRFIQENQDNWKPDFGPLQQSSARQSTKKLVEAIEKVLS